MTEPSAAVARRAPVTVVIPAYEASGTMAAALASVAGQTAVPEKVVVVDDGSTDATADAARAAMPAATVIVQTNAGPSAARNRALEEVDTPWVAFLDADDRWHPDKLADQLQAAGRHPAAVAVASDWVRDEIAFPPKPRTVTETVFGPTELLVLNRFQTSTAMCRTEDVRAVGGFRSELDGVEDWDMWWRLSERGPLVKLDWPYVAYRDVGTGYSKDLWRVYRTMLAMLERVRADATVDRRRLETVLAWHHLRFATAFLLERSPAQARRVLGQLRRDHLLHAAPSAAARYLAPFLAGRVRRRIRRSTVTA